MACACTHSLRLVTKTTICLDIFYSAFGKKPKLQLLERESLLNPTADGVTLSLISEYPPRPVSNKGVYLSFFIGGIALSLCWNAFGFIVPYWIMQYDKSIWRDFVVCYNFPGFPILVVQLFTDEYVAKRIGTRNAYIARIGFAFLLIACLTGFVPLTQQGDFDRTKMLVFASMIGVAVGCGHGWAYSVASYYPSQAVGYLAAGGGMSTILLIILTLVLDVSNVTVRGLFEYFEPVFFLSLLGTGCLLALFFSPYSTRLLAKVDSGDIQGGGHGVPASSDDTPMLKDEAPNPHETKGPIVKQIWSPLISVFLLLFSIVAAVALIPNVPSATNNPKFPQYILYVTSIAAFVGNELAVYLKFMKNKWNLLIFSSVRFLILPFLLIYARPHFWHNDFFILGVLAVFGMSGSFGVSKCYTVTSAAVSLKAQAAASNYLNIMLYVGVYFGLAFPYVLPYL